MRTYLRSSPLVSLLQVIPIGVLLFCLFFAIYSLFIYGNIRFGDEAERYFQARSLVASHNLVIPFIPGEGIKGVDNQPYSQFEMGYGLLLVPLYAIGKVFSEFIPLADPDWVPLLFVSLSNAIITSLTCFLLYRLSRLLGISKRIAVLTTLVYGLGTIAFPYSRALYREPTQALGLISTVYAMIKFRQTSQSRWLLISGIGFGYLAFAKIANMFMLPFFPVYLLLVSSQVGWNRRLRTAAEQTLLFLIPIVLLLTVQGVVNVIKFGNFFNIGPYNYGNPLPYFSLSRIVEGVGGLLFSPTKSLFIFSPPVVLFIPAWVSFFKRHRVESLLVLSLVVGNVLFSGSYFLWDGGTYWGPRYLVVVVPLMILPLGFLFQETRGVWPRLWAALTGSAFIAGLGVQLLGALTNDREYTDVTGRTIDVAGAWDMFRHGALESLVFSLSPTDGLEMNLIGWMMLVLILLLLSIIFLQSARADSQTRFESGLVVGGALLAVIIMAFLSGIVIPYPRVLAAKGDTKYLAANSFFGEQRFCEAQYFYKLALSLRTNFQQESVARLEEIAPGAQGLVVDVGGLMAQRTDKSQAEVGRDSSISVSHEGAVRIDAPGANPRNVETTTDFVRVRPNTKYQVSAWYRSEGVSDSGLGMIAWYEDDAKWQQKKTLDLWGFNGTQGWQLFRETLTTLPTTRRAMLKAGLWQASGTIWVDGLRLVQVVGQVPPSLCVR